MTVVGQRVATIVGAMMVTAVVVPITIGAGTPVVTIYKASICSVGMCALSSQGDGESTSCLVAIGISSLV